MDKNITYIYFITIIKEQELNENSLNMDGLTLTSPGTIELNNISKFYFRSNPLATLKVVGNRFTTILRIVNSTFKFAYNLQQPDLNSVCNSGLLVQLPSSSSSSSRASRDLHYHSSLMSSANYIILDHVRFVEPVCPLLFINVRMSNFHVIAPQPTADSFRFLEVVLSDQLIESQSKREREKTTALNCRIKHVFFVNTTFRPLDSRVLNKFVFYNMNELRLQNVKIESMAEKVS